MVDITAKNNTLRVAVAIAQLEVSSEQTIQAIVDRQVSKGDVLEFSRAAGLLAIKKTSDVIPDCHPLPIEAAKITHSIQGLTIDIRVEVKTIYKTGVEVEAMHGAAITALTMYDMLKPIDKQVSIGKVYLQEKTGGKSDAVSDYRHLKAAVLVCSDSVSAGAGNDRSGKLIQEKLAHYGINTDRFLVVPDDVQSIQTNLKQWVAAGISLVVLTGGTGLSLRDVTPEAIRPLLDQEISGVMEAARSYGQQRTPYAMLSRGLAGFIQDTLVIALPGSPKGVKESMDAIFPAVFHCFAVRNGNKHQQ